MRAVIGQAGKGAGAARRQLDDGAGLGRVQRDPIDRDRSLGKRWLSACDAPDLVLLPRLYPTLKAVDFYAGLELSILHVGLWLLSWLVKRGWLKSLLPLHRPLHWVADQLHPLGSDRGGMLVDVEGINADGRPMSYRWRLVAEKGQGPFVPAAPAAALVARLARGESLPAGAYPCLGILALDEILAQVAHLPVFTLARSKDRSDLFALAMHRDFSRLPEPIRIIHSRQRCASASGRCDVDRSGNPLALLIRALFRMPHAGRDLPVTVRFIARGGSEHWERDFSGRIMRSRLSHARIPGEITEQFGAFAFTIRLRWDGTRLHYQIVKGKLFGIRLPHALLPRVAALEMAVEDRFWFDVSLRAPLVGLLAHYRGWLQTDEIAVDVERPADTPARMMISGAAADRG